MTKDEALRLCEYLECNDASMEAQCEAAAFIREALAQAEREPIGYLCENAVGHKYFRWKKPPSTYNPIALYK